MLRGDATALQGWTDAGYNVIYDNSHCANASDFGDWIQSNYAPMTGKTLVRTTCSVQFSNTHDIDFKGDFALFASGSAGISTSNQVGLDSDSSTVHNVYLIVPYDAATRPCTAPGISTANNFGSSGRVNLLVYSPCNVSFSNNGVPSQGQAYSGSTIQINNNLLADLRPDAGVRHRSGQPAGPVLYGRHSLQARGPQSLAASASGERRVPP